MLSRLLTPEQVGASVALFTILASCELVTTIGLEQFVMVNAGERRAQAVAAAQQMAFLRGLLLATAILILAPALAKLFGAGTRDISWLGVVSLINGLKNLRVFQIQQEYKFIPEAVSTIGGQFGAVIAVLAAAAWFQDERAMVASLAAEAIVNVALSYLLAPRERVAAIDPMMRRAALTFGLPLLLNGIGLMILGQSDRLIIINLFGLTTLARYSLAVNLAIAPVSILSTIAGKLGMPFMTGARADHEAWRRASLILLLGVIVAAAYAVPVGLFLHRIVPLVYGAQYEVTPTFSLLMACVAFLRICRGGPNLVLLARSQTASLTAGNMISGVGVLVGFLLGMRYGQVEMVVVGLIMGDALSLALLSVIVSRHLGVRRVTRSGAWRLF